MSASSSSRIRPLKISKVFSSVLSPLSISIGILSIYLTPKKFFKELFSLTYSIADSSYKYTERYKGSSFM